MIARLTGKLLEKGLDAVVIEASGVGYEVFVPMRVLDFLPAVGDLASLHIVTNVREDAIQLFGFASGAERRLFQRLTTVSGIGPKLALSALGTYSPAEFQAAVVKGDEKAISRIPGVGKKMAQRILLEIGEKVALMDLEGVTAAARASRHSSAEMDELFLALLDLGYSRKQAEETSAKLAPKAEGKSTEALVRMALALLRS